MVVLVVEDDGLINMMVRDELQQEGYEVVSAYNADEAIEILECRDDVRLIFTDIDMPGSTAPTTATDTEAPTNPADAKRTLMAQVGSRTAASGVFVGFVEMGPLSGPEIRKFSWGDFKNRGGFRLALLG
jgi:DNA-binding NtrC family response regulator